MSLTHRYSDPDRDAIYRVIAERRDMRHFRSDPIPPDILQRVLHAAHQAPSVGLMQPWRFIRITDSALRERIHALVDAERQLTAEALGERDAEFLRLKVEGVRDCAELWVAALMDQREAHVFGRRTLPEMDLASVACAIQNMWLAARAEGLGHGLGVAVRPAGVGSSVGYSRRRQACRGAVSGAGRSLLPRTDAATGRLAQPAGIGRNVV